MTYDREPKAASPNGASSEPGESGIDALAIWRTVLKYWATALATALVIAVAVAFYTLGQTKIYEATTTVQFDPNPPRPLGGKVEAVVEMGSGPVWDPREYYETQYQIIQSMRVATAVVTELGLHRDAGFVYNTPKDAPLPKMGNITEEQAAEILRSRLKVEPVKGSRLALLRLQDANPERAQRVLSSVVDTYVAQNIQIALDATVNANDWLKEQMAKLKIDLEKSEMDLHEYKKNNNLLSAAFDDRSNMLREQMGQLNQLLTSVRAKSKEVQARRDQLAKVKVDDPSQMPASELLGNILLSQFRSQYIEAKRAREALIGAGKGPNYDEVKAADARMEESRRAVLLEVKNIQGALDRELAAVRQQESGLAGLLEQSKKEALELNLLEIEHNRLRRSKENTEKLYSLLLERTKESDLARMLNVNNVRVLDRPRVPRVPVRPNVVLNIGAGILIGLLLGIATAMGRAMLDRTIKTPGDVEQVLGVSFLGLIPELEPSKEAALQKARRRGRPISPGRELIVHEMPTSGIAEASRSIRTNILFTAPDKPYKVMLVTSAAMGEGKTTVACCIAIAMAQTGKRVILVDCDLRRPRLHRIFQRPSDVGLTTALVDEAHEDHIEQSEVPNLSIYVAGPHPPNPAELLQSERFRTVLKRLTGKFDYVILDSPPVLAVTDAAVLSTLVDGVVMVTRAFQTRKELAQHALRRLTDVGAHVAGVVLNAVNLTKDEYKYSYQYYRRGGYYEDDENRKRVSQVEVAPRAAS
ncbi:MAG: polysaccharide biosynthesis tyrosine autokinase [Polyangiaceae bacterium]|nr:polysaccharide biosynthesis tyrosine autokinase [Polyangiaceae bacterium]